MNNVALILAAFTMLYILPSLRTRDIHRHITGLQALLEIVWGGLAIALLLIGVFHALGEI